MFRVVAVLAPLGSTYNVVRSAGNGEGYDQLRPMVRCHKGRIRRSVRVRGGIPI